MYSHDYQHNQCKWKVNDMPVSENPLHLIQVFSSGGQKSEFDEFFSDFSFFGK
jgi:hypothetical protein